MDAAQKAALSKVRDARGTDYVDARTTLLAARPPARTEIVAALNTMSTDPSWEARLAAEALLGGFADPALWATVSKYAKGDLPAPFRSWEEPTPEICAGHIAALGPRVVPRLLELVYMYPLPADADEMTALFTALLILADARVVPAMKALLDGARPGDPPGSVPFQRGAIRVLSATRTPEAFERVLAGATDPTRDPTVRAAAIFELRHFRDARTMRVLLDIVAREESPAWARNEAATAIGSVGDPAAAREIVARLPRERDPSVASKLAISLGSIGTLADIPPLQLLMAGSTSRLAKTIADTIDDILYREKGIVH